MWNKVFFEICLEFIFKIHIICALIFAQVCSLMFIFAVRLSDLLFGASNPSALLT